ncbi:hypothetical protein [Streptomyces sp. NPDC126514]|uniref:hypothetical protein n=1 Tax=Streptomyces sp. NPDC126514 TaxID=3155210 RepID=UPI00331A77FB
MIVYRAVKISTLCGRTGARAAAVTLAALLMGACSAPSQSALPVSEQDRSNLIKAAQQVLVNRCMQARDTVESTPRQAVLFGAGRTELSLTLATGYTVRAHTDGCLAQAHRFLYGDQTRWFRAEVIVNNLRPMAQAQLRQDPAYRAALARRDACTDHDASCVRASGLKDLRTRLEPVRLAQVRAAHRDDLITYDRLRDRAVHLAASLLADHPTPHPKGTSRP